LPARDFHAISDVERAYRGVSRGLIRLSLRALPKEKRIRCRGAAAPDAPNRVISGEMRE